jgi:type I restriction enzyme R subunit
VQSLLINNKYRTHFSPTDFDLVISDEAHRSISGDARAVFEYFVGYKLGLTATPRDYLKSFDSSAPTSRDPRELERRQLLDTYTTFGCESGEPTFRYSLLDGVTDGFLINPKVVDARTDITTKLLSEEGYAVVVARGEESEEGDAEETFFHRDFEKKFFSEPTNRMFCETFLRHALGDPISGELGKSLVFAVSQAHATKLTQMLNELAEVLFPGKYQSDFAVQVTSLIPGAQQYTINFANNNLLGSGNFIESYKTSKARVCVTVGMMTTGYDCPDILNLAMMRPIFSPSEFVQIKGRGTRKHTFTENLFDEELKAQLASADAEKVAFKLFDFFGNCEYFEEKFNYDEIIELPRLPTGKVGTGAPPGPPLPSVGLYENHAPDPLKLIREEQVGLLGMKIDRMLFQKFEETVKADTTLVEHVAAERWEQAVAYVSEKVLEKPTEHFTLEKLRTAVGVDRRLGLREILEKVFGRIARFKSKEELLGEEFEKFVLACKIEDVENLDALRYFFTAYLTDSHLRGILESKRLTELNTNPNFGIADYRAVPEPWRTRIPEYIKDYVSLNAFL